MNQLETCMLKCNRVTRGNLGHGVIWAKSTPSLLFQFVEQSNIVQNQSFIAHFKAYSLYIPMANSKIDLFCTELSNPDSNIREKWGKNGNKKLASQNFLL